MGVWVATIMLIDGINTINKKFIDTFLTGAKEIPELKGIVIFGSSIREDCTENSDIDIILISDTRLAENKEYSLQVSALLEKCYAVQCTPVDLLELHDVTEIETRKTIFCDTLREEGYKYFALH